eukprot:TRINITY_DN585_c0_g5_i1.p1 TRINITY_DN585_c0_g5~~TRINITY_DN585_c0_g5_i1.p1  ORF type:complete len:162 (+),score=14.66 TRINITY_DN585_c0_g5_i1:73-558(+)
MCIRDRSTWDKIQMVEAPGDTIDKKVLDEELDKQKEWHRVIIIDHEGNVVTSRKLTGALSAEEMKLIMESAEDRDRIVGPGYSICGDHFDVLRFHPPLVFGRRGGSNEGEGEGITYCRIKSKVDGKYIHFVITYILPMISARVVPQMLDFAKKFRTLYTSN